MEAGGVNIDALLTWYSGCDLQGRAILQVRRGVLPFLFCRLHPWSFDKSEQVFHDGLATCSSWTAHAFGECQGCVRSTVV